MNTAVQGTVEHLPPRAMNKIHWWMNTQLTGLNKPKSAPFSPAALPRGDATARVPLRVSVATGVGRVSAG